MRNVILTAGLSLALVLAGPAGSASATNPRVVVYVASQGLCFESVVAPNSLPDRGPFQELLPSTRCGPGTFMTRFGPGDHGYVGGRWVTPDGVRFSCPLIGPGFAPGP
jgi:hypothetical protein